MKGFIPNFLTLLNLFSGCIGITAALNGDLYLAAYLIWLGAFFDFLDGFMARLLKVKSDIGKELDSLADIVTFGVLPSMIMFTLVTDRSDQLVFPYLVFSIALFSAIRLARFNVDNTQSEHFKGLPTPACALFISGIPFLLEDPGFVDFSGRSSVLVAISLVLSLLLVSNIRLFSLKFKDWSLKGNSVRYIFLLISLLLIIFIKIPAIPLIIIVYIATSIAANIITG